jgi:hypothetical protein
MDPQNQNQNQPSPVSTQPTPQTPQPSLSSPTPSSTESSEPTVPMIAPDGNVADIPQSRRVDATLNGGYKYGIEMIDPQGREAVIPSERAKEAMDKGGYKLKNPNQPLYEKAMQQSMGGPPQFVDVPIGTKELFEKAGQEGYTRGSEIGLGTLAAAGTAASVMPVLEALAPHLPEIDKVIKIAKALGYGAFGLNELHRIMQAIKK